MGAHVQISAASTRARVVFRGQAFTCVSLSPSSVQRHATLARARVAFRRQTSSSVLIISTQLHATSARGGDTASRMPCVLGREPLAYFCRHVVAFRALVPQSGIS